MKFSTQEEYGLRCILDIAALGVGESITIPEISKLEGLSQHHVAKLLSILRKEGFVQATRGHTGGYTLARPAESILVGQVLAALGGRLYDDAFCERHSGLDHVCKHNTGCAIRALWSSVQSAVDKILMSVSIAQLVVLEREETSNVRVHASPIRQAAPKHPVESSTR